MGYRWSGNNVDPTVSSRSRIDSGTSVPSRLGFRGTEKLGNGLTAGFILEAAVDAAGGAPLGGGGFSSVGAGYNAGDGYQTSFAAGIRHSF